jgi:hypothetical protein
MQTTINRAGWLIAAILALFVIASMTGVVRGGPLDPPGPPGSTLPQVEPRSPIPPVGWDGTFPIVISQPGSYFLTRPLTGVENTDGIQITNGTVSLDLNGFTLTGVNKTGAGIKVLGLRANIHISNGVVRDWYYGINGWNDDNNQAVFSRVEQITAFNNGEVGIRLGYDSEIIDCNASQNAGGIFTHYSVVRRCHVTDNIAVGIQIEDVSLVEDNKVWNNIVGISMEYTGLQPGNSTVRSNTSTNNSGADIYYSSAFNVLDSNVATCPGWVHGPNDAQIYNQMYQRNPC